MNSMPLKHRSALNAPTPRDVLILRGLFETRIMTRGHIASLFFDGRTDAAKKRVQKLKAAGLLGERPRRVNERSILFVTKVGYRALYDNGHLENMPSFSWSEKRMRVSDLTLRHELAVMDIKAAMTTAIDKVNHFRVLEFCTWPKANAFRAQRPSRGDLVTVRPDGLLRVEETGANDERFEHCFFVELDRSTETLDVLCQRALCYRAHYTSGGFAVRCGGKREEFKEFPFRVLMIFNSAQRRDNLADRLLELSPPILSQAWLSTYPEVIATPLAPIWIEPRDRRTVTAIELPKRAIFDGSHHPAISGA